MTLDDDDLQATIKRAEGLRTTFEHSPRATIEPPLGAETLAEWHAQEVLASIAAGTDGITLEKTLGEGGMGTY